MKKNKIFILIVSFLFNTQPTEKQLSSDDIKNLATEIFNQYIETNKKILAMKKPSSTKETVGVFFIVLIAPTCSLYITYKLINTNFADLIKSIFTRSNNLEIDISKKDSVLPDCLKEVKLNNKQDKFILFYGPSGTGKSFGASVLIAKEKGFCKETDGNIFNVESLVGTDITKINNFFKELETLSSKNPKQKIVAVIDEFESIGDRATTNSQEKSRVDNAVNLMLNKMDQIKRKFKNVYIIFTTNYREKIDKALLTRCALQISFELPSIEMIQKILKDNFTQEYVNLQSESNYIELIKSDISEKNTKKNSLNLNNIIIDSGNYEEEKHDFWFGLLDFEITKTEIEISYDLKKKEILLNKKTILTQYKDKLNEEKNFYKFFGILANLHEFNLRDINSLIEKKNEVQSLNDFIKIFSDKIVFKNFIKKKIDKKQKEKICMNLTNISNTFLEKKIKTLEENFKYS